MVFLYDYDVEELEVPKYIPTKTISFSKNAISIAVQSEVDGPVALGLSSLEMFNKIDYPAFEEVFIDLENPLLTLSVIGEERLGAIKAKAGNCKVCIAIDEIDSPSIVSIFVEQPD